VITSMLDVLDDCDRAEKQLQASDDEQLKTGVQQYVIFITPTLIKAVNF